MNKYVVIMRHTDNKVYLPVRVEATSPMEIESFYAKFPFCKLISITLLSTIPSFRIVDGKLDPEKTEED